ncbi:MAG TPA: HAD family hydrolase [Planctomycetaceae bacterium]|nr:HAD family hydrolase [Planctomycetaceae bacterium]
MHVCLFDIDGTLIHTRGAGMAALREGLRSAFGVDEPTDQVAVHGRTDRGITRDLFRFHGIDDRQEHWERFRAAYLRALPASLAARTGSVLPGIVALLEGLRARHDVVLGLLTGNTREGARIKLSHFALDQYFEFGGFGDNHLERDDVAREALAAVTGRVNGRLDLDRVWVIGDTPTDVSCGRAIGARTIAVATGNHTLEELSAAAPDHLAPDFSDPEPILALWR